MGGFEMSSAAMVNIISRGTTKKEMRETYRDYPDTQPKGFESFHASTVEPIFCEVPPGSRVLDVGCNSGEMMKLLRDAKGCDVMGVDVSTNALKLARKKKLKVYNATAEKLPFLDDSFDVVILREVLVHIHEPVKALKEIRRVLRPKGFLLGSAPHANLEKMIWDDKRLHHRYYNEETLLADLSQAFEHTHIKTLNGAQFAISFLQSLLASETAEILWKSGHADVPEWEHDLLADTKTLRVWMGPTQPIGDAYYRMIGFANKMRQLKDTEVAFETFSWSDDQGAGRWQSKLLMNKDGEPVSSLALHHFDACLKVANPWVFQITPYQDILDLFESMKEAYPEKKLITETDDWIFDIPAYNVASHPYRPNSLPEQIAFQQLGLSDAIICSTEFLKENMNRMFPGKPVHVVPNSIDFSIWDNLKTEVNKNEKVVRLIYSGCGNHSGDLEIVKPVLLALLEEFENLEIVMIQDFKCFSDVTHPRFIQMKRWAFINNFPALLKSLNGDIGIAPLRDNDFNRAKSNLRWLEYSALKIPTVASAVRPFNDSITHESDGLLCSTKGEWYALLKSLIEDPLKRQAIGEAAYSTVKTKFNMDQTAQLYADILKGARC
jgi:SAM-dependent methyltransferase